MAINTYPTRGMFGGRLNAYLQGRRAKVKHFEAVGVDNDPDIGTTTAVTGLKKDDVILFVYDATANADRTVEAQGAGTITIAGDISGNVLVVAWLTRH